MHDDQKFSQNTCYTVCEEEPSEEYLEKARRIIVEDGLYGKLGKRGEKEGRNAVVGEQCIGVVFSSPQKASQQHKI